MSFLLTRINARLFPLTRSNNRVFAVTKVADIPNGSDTLLTTTTISTIRIDLAWVINSVTESGHSIERSLNGMTFTVLSTVAKGVSSYSDTSCSEGTLYYYRVRAYRDGYSNYTNIASATTIATEYETVYNAMTTKPSYADMVIQNQMIKALVDGGYFTKADVLDVFATHTNATGEALINWANPTGTTNPTIVNVPAFESYAGFTGAVGTGINSNYNPTADGDKISVNDICMIVGCGTESQHDAGIAGVRDASGRLLILPRSTSDTIITAGNTLTNYADANTLSMAHFAVSRQSVAGYLSYVNSDTTYHTDADTGLPNNNVYVCGWGINGSPSFTPKQVPYLFIFSGLSEAEINDVMYIMELYLDNYGNRLGYESPSDTGLVSLHLTPTTIYVCGS